MNISPVLDHPVHNESEGHFYGSEDGLKVKPTYLPLNLEFFNSEKFNL
jgi:hypothetical protein